MSKTQIEDDTPTPLETRLVKLIRDHGPIRVGDFMTDALIHPQHGYYATQTALGAQGDFTTSPEISQVFGELIGSWLVHSWEAMGAPSAFNLVELGPGRGTLMSDILRVAKVRPRFLQAVHVYMIEASGRMRYAQKHLLAETGVTITWADKLEDVPLGPTLLVANEFFDCLPIRQFVRTASDGDTPWRERLVGLTDDDRLAFVLSEKEYGGQQGMPPGAKPEDIFETCSVGGEIIAEIGHRLRDAKGRALIIDYGHGRAGYGDTLQAMKGHQFWPVLQKPGLADVTAHVDFSALARRARAEELRTDGPVRQGDFLERLGLKLRLEAVAKGIADEKKREEFVSGGLRLIDRDGMGSLFKVLALSPKGSPVPPGFE
ncbi:class I SAM-dependent methyltransferase [Parvularcula lutaonensis]|uniref:Class I SAM-dependent methyltransferase n=1 Tax=Parvularcula lutaonensis TaxID=491923 RepID=A0ABV7MD57_9PROT|nr:SAM-dependent methyltransferase [Parvularcula lutaonensis]GGY39714.1 ATP synthase subunit beta [Parvularcula lutaonensis]